jgi:hypothetical protein
MKRYTIRRLRDEIDPTTALASPLWKTAEAARIDIFPWYRSGLRQETEVRILYAPDALHVLFTAQDIHSSARPRELNGPVCEDSCVEFFAAPWPCETLDYFNCEVNCCGALHLGFGSGRHGRTLIAPDQAARLTLRSTCRPPAKEEGPGDHEWSVYVRLPRAALSEFCGREVGFCGTWRANLYRCGGATDPQYACWNPVGTPRPDFHRPEYFGLFVFAA